MEPRGVACVLGCCMLLEGCFLLIPCKRLVDNKYSRHVYRILKGFQLCLEISCSHPCSKEKHIWRFKSHGSQITCHFYFFSKREIYFFFSKGIYCCSPNFFIFSENSNKARIKLHERKGAFWQNTHSAPWKVICASFVRCAFISPLKCISSLDSPPVWT